MAATKNAATPIVYVFCDNNCKYEGMTKEQIYAAILQAVSTGTIGNCDTGFITTVKTINGTPLRFFVGTQYEYTALSAAEKENLFAIITDDLDKDNLFKAIETLQKTVDEVSLGIRNGAIVVAIAAEADHAKRATNADYATYDASERRFQDTYLSISADNYEFSGLADTNFGATVWAKPENEGGNAYIVTWELEYETICFGVVWWNGETSTRSLAAKYSNTDYCVVIEKSGEGSDDAVEGTARLYKVNPSTGALNMAEVSGTLKLRCMTTPRLGSGN